MNETQQNKFNVDFFTDEFKNEKQYKLVKVGTPENALYPESNFGESKPFHYGIMFNPPTIGEPFSLIPKNKFNGGISTSMVTDIKDDLIYTLNSIYQLSEYHEDTPR
jgi:hypothetical protein